MEDAIPVQNGHQLWWPKSPSKTATNIRESQGPGQIGHHLCTPLLASQTRWPTATKAYRHQAALLLPEVAQLRCMLTPRCSGGRSAMAPAPLASIYWLLNYGCISPIFSVDRCYCRDVSEVLHSYGSLIRPRRRVRMRIILLWPLTSATVVL